MASAIIGLALCAAIGWIVVALTIRVGVLAGAGVIVAGAVILALAWLAIRRRRRSSDQNSRLSTSSTPRIKS